jgi:hypothetical protein
VHSRRARPTLRLLTEDLTSGWDSPLPQRALAAGDLDALHPLSELPHPIIAKAAESCTGDPTADTFVGQISSATRLRLLEIKTGQWRGGIWQDPDTDVNWLVVAGLAKGEHQDHDDFYVQVKKANDAGTTDPWLPTDSDVRLLKRETAARLLTDWELGLQRLMLTALQAVHDGGQTRGTIPHPIPKQGSLADFELSVTQYRDVDYDVDEIELELTPVTKHAASNMLWQATVRLLISLNPPEQGWDRDRDTYMTFAEPGTFTYRITELQRLDENGELGASVPGTVSHYTHRTHLAGSTINGKAVRALCGVYFVPTQDHATLAVCPSCEQRYAELPK